MAKAATPTPPVAQPLVEAKLPPTPNPPANNRASAEKKHGFEYPPGPPDESKLIRIAHFEKVLYDSASRKGFAIAFVSEGAN
jgi:hypothetical protein